MKPTDSLRRDHLLIEKMNNALRIVSNLLREGKEIPETILKQSIDFSINFTNQCHHSKEEDSLFPALEKKGMPKQGGPIARMIYEHGITKNLAEDIAKSADIYLKNCDSSQLIKAIDKYVEHVEMHLSKENQKLFVMADMILSDDFKEIDHELYAVEQTYLENNNLSRKYYEKIVDEIQSING